MKGESRYTALDAFRALSAYRNQRYHLHQHLRFRIEPSPPRKVTIRYECEVCQKVFVFTLEYTYTGRFERRSGCCYLPVCAEIALKDFVEGFPYGRAQCPCSILSKVSSELGVGKVGEMRNITCHRPRKAYGDGFVAFEGIPAFDLRAFKRMRNQLIEKNQKSLASQMTSSTFKPKLKPYCEETDN